MYNYAEGYPIISSGCAAAAAAAVSPAAVRPARDSNICALGAAGDDEGQIAEHTDSNSLTCVSVTGAANPRRRRRRMRTEGRETTY